MSASQDVRTGRVTVDGDELFYEVRGAGEPLLMIPPGGGDGWQYARVAELLADRFRTIVFDRRANGRSTMNAPQNFTIQQQSDDAVAVLRAVGEESAHVFGNSSGAVIALDLAVRHPDRTRVVYTARPDFVGTDTFTYTAVDANTSTTTGKVTVIVTDASTPATPPPAPGTDPPSPVLTDQLFLPALLR